MNANKDRNSTDLREVRGNATRRYRIRQMLDRAGFDQTSVSVLWDEALNAGDSNLADDCRRCFYGLYGGLSSTERVIAALRAAKEASR